LVVAICEKKLTWHKCH